MLSRDFDNKKLTEGQIRQTPCELEVVYRYRIDYNIIYRDFKDDCYELWITGSVLVIIFQDRQSINGNTNEASNELS